MDRVVTKIVIFGNRNLRILPENFHIGTFVVSHFAVYDSYPVTTPIWRVSIVFEIPHNNL
jgi:hypothetical protein